MCEDPAHYKTAQLVSNGFAISDNLDKASLLNSFFYKCFNANSPPLPNLPPNLQPSDYPAELLCDKAEVYNLILSLDPTKSTGPDGISVKMLKGTIDAIVPSLTRLFNLSDKILIYVDLFKSLQEQAVGHTVEGLPQIEENDTRVIT